jgi:hypothetical protein
MNFLSPVSIGQRVKLSARQSKRLTHDGRRRYRAGERRSLNHTGARRLGGRRQTGQRQEPERRRAGRHNGSPHWKDRMKDAHRRRSPKIQTVRKYAPDQMAAVTAQP